MYAPDTARDRAIMSDNWRATDDDVCWRAVVCPTGRKISVPLSDVGRICALQHRHVPLRAHFGDLPVAQLARHVRRGLPAGAACCGPRRRRGADLEWTCHVDAATGADKFEVVGACSGRPFRLETTRTHPSAAAVSADES